MVSGAEMQGSRRGLSWLVALLAASVAISAALLVSTEAATAAGINSFGMSLSNTQAGGHPDWTIEGAWEERNSEPGGGCACSDVKELIFSAQTGMIGNPHAVPRCTLLQFGQHQCPSESQIGIVMPEITIPLPFQQPLYNMEPHPEQPGLVAFETPLLNTPIFIDLSGRTESDYGLDITTSGIFHPIPLKGVKVYVWGVPGIPVHDTSRLPTPQGGILCISHYPEPCGPGVEFHGPVEPLLQSPTTCGVPLNGGINLRYYDFQVFHAETPVPEMTGCDQLSFDPSLSATPTTTQADTPSGIDIDAAVPQTQSPTTPTASQIRSLTVTLPQGFSVNPSAADGKSSCADVQGAFGTRGPAHCPEESKIGTLTVDSSALPGPIDGAIYLGEPLPEDKYRIFLVADGYSTHVKLAGSVHLDSKTGQVVTIFNDLPQTPFSRFTMHFFGAERGLLATPERCGTYPVKSEFVPWDSALATHTFISYFNIDSGPNGTPCPSGARPFHPAVKSGMADNTAGVHSTFALQVIRPDGDQSLAGLRVLAPRGFSAKLAGVPYCPEAALARISAPGYSGLAEQGAPACPAASQVGTVMTEAGAGSRPLHVPGKVFLAGPYKGAPLSVVVVVPAVSGPYDLGTVAVRAAITVSPTNARVSTVSDEIPQILEGVPLRVREFEVKFDRPNFALNPTNCEPSSVDSEVLGIEGAAASLSNRFQVANCADLPYEPKLDLKLSGGVRRRGHPAIHATFTAKPGEANTREVAVALPKGEILDNAHIGNVCTRVQFAANTCPASSILGFAEASTPLLDAPLKGNAYLRSSSNPLPDIAIDLEGQVNFELVGRVDTAGNGALRTTFEAPDVPVSRLILDLAGGSKGLVQNSNSLCGARKAASTKMVGQNGTLISTKNRLRVSCGPKGSHKRRSTQKGAR
jgi:hypothetical protein